MGTFVWPSASQGRDQHMDIAGAGTALDSGCDVRVVRDPA
jgi:hypothetical protein